MQNNAVRSKTHFLKWDDVLEFFNDKSVAIVGSGPSCLQNKGSRIDNHDIIVRVNNYKIDPAKTGRRTDVHYSFYGNSIKKTSLELQKDGVKMCMCKCPDARFMESEWHNQHNAEHGVDFRWIYAKRAGWWFCDTYAPDLDRFMEYFYLLNNHIPSTGFQCILEILKTNAKSIYITGFDFFSSRVHNVNERWQPGRPDDPIRHMPEYERKYLVELEDERVIFDDTLQKMKDFG